MSDDPKKTTNTSGGLANEGAIHTDSGDVIGRDKNISGDKVDGDFVGRDKIVHITRLDPADAISLRNHSVLRDAVRVFWVDGVLKNSLDNELLNRPDFYHQPDAVKRPWNLITQQPNQPERAITKDKSICDVFNEMGRQMLILGASGSGKTTTLLTLTEMLLEECAADPTLPTPVVFNLSSWSEKQLLDEWLVEELNQRYKMPKKVAQGWVDNDELLFLLDGLDEVAERRREACVSAINNFHQEHVVDMVVCSRIQEYEALTERLNLRGAIAIRSLTEQQISRQVSGVRVSRVTLSIDTTIDNFTNTQLETLIEKIAEVSGIDPDEVYLYDIRRGSVRVTLEMPEDAAEEFVSKFTSTYTNLDEFSIRVEKTEKVESGRSSGSFTILCLAADPSDQARLRLGKEHREITDAVDRARGNIEIQNIWAVKAKDVLRYLLKFRPQIVHFSGHGTEKGELAFEAESGHAKLVQAKTLGILFGELSYKIQGVVLNACGSAAQADEIAKHVDHVICMSGPIDDLSSIAFSSAFYESLASGETIRNSFNLGRAELQVEGLQGVDCLNIYGGCDELP